MRISRIFIAQDLQPGESIRLSGSASNHLVSVLRLGPGAEFELFNGDGNNYAARIASVEKKGLVAEIFDYAIADSESPLQICLVQSVARGDKMDLILQKATELGVSQIQPILSERTEVRLDADRLEKRMQHWHSVICSACEQSGRARVPVLRPLLKLEQCAVGDFEGDHKVFLHPQATATMSELALASDVSVSVAIGPEGGFSEADLARLSLLGFYGLRIGPRVLRTETAGMAVIAALQAQYGDW